MEYAQGGYNALVFGGSGACGYEFLKQIASNPSWTNIFVPLRRPCAEVLEVTAGNPKFKVIETADVLNLDAISAAVGGRPIHSVFVFFGSSMGISKQDVFKLHNTMILDAAKLAQQLRPRTFALLSSATTGLVRAFYLFRVKGQTQEDLKSIVLPSLIIYKPGLLVGRKDPRFIEKIGAYFPIEKIEVPALVRKIIGNTERILTSGQDSGFQALEHRDIAALPY